MGVSSAFLFHDIETNQQQPNGFWPLSFLK